MSTKRSKVVFDEWDTYVVQSEGRPLFISFDVDAARRDLTDTLQHCARVLIPIAAPNKNGGPVKPESDRIYAMEDALREELSRHGVECRLVARLTCAGTRELVFQVEDYGPFRPVVGLWMQSQPDYDIDVSEHDGWGFFDAVVRPSPETWLYLGDRSVVDNLVKYGS